MYPVHPRSLGVGGPGHSSRRIHTRLLNLLCLPLCLVILAALNDALKEEIQHLKLLTAQPISNGGTMMTFPASFGGNQPFYPSSQAMNTLLTAQQFQQLQIHSQKQQHQYQQHQLHQLQQQQLQQPQHPGDFKLRSSIPSSRDNVSDSKSTTSKD